MLDNNNNDDADSNVHPASPVRGRHRRVRSGANGEHTELSLFGSLADVMEVLTIIDEVEADPVGSHLHTAFEPLPFVSEGAQLVEPMTSDTHAGTHHTFAGGSAGTSHHIMSPASCRRGRHSRGACLTEGLLKDLLEVKDAFVEELNEADDGDTRACS